MRHLGSGTWQAIACCILTWGYLSWPRLDAVESKGRCVSRIYNPPVTRDAWRLIQVTIQASGRLGKADLFCQKQRLLPVTFYSNLRTKRVSWRLNSKLVCLITLFIILKAKHCRVEWLVTASFWRVTIFFFPPAVFLSTTWFIGKIAETLERNADVVKPVRGQGPDTPTVLVIVGQNGFRTQLMTFLRTSAGIVNTRYTSMFYSLETLARNGDSFSITALIFSAHHGIIRVFKFVYTTRSTRRIRSLAFAVVCLCPRKNYDSQRTEPISYSSLVDILKFWKFRVISFRLKFAYAM